MRFQTREKLEFKIWQQEREINRLESENTWAKVNIATVIFKDNALIQENKLLKAKIEELQKKVNADGDIENYPDVFTKSELWKKDKTENNRLLDVLFNRESDTTVRLTIPGALAYVEKELIYHG